MKIDYDKDADALYIELKRGTFWKNKKIDGLTILDLDEKGDFLGIELLNASKRIPKKALSSAGFRKLGRS